MRAWLFQDTRQKQKLGEAKCPWSVGWYEADGRKRSKRVGSKSMAEKFRLKKETELEHGIATPRSTAWVTFRLQLEGTIIAPMGVKNRREALNALAHFERIAKPKRVDAVTTAVVDLYRTRRQGERGRRKGTLVSPATVNKELRYLRAAFNVAADWGLMSKPPKVRMLREPQRDPEFVDDETFAKLYEACDTMVLPAAQNHTPAEWWRAVLTFAYLTGWRIGEILAIRRDDVDFNAGTVFVPAEKTKGRRDASIGLHPVGLDHCRTIVGFDEMLFAWPHHERTLWTHFAKLKKAAGVEFSGAFHRLRFGFANANVDSVPADVLQRLMRHQNASTTQGYINHARRMRLHGEAERLHVPAVLKRAT